MTEIAVESAPVQATPQPVQEAFERQAPKEAQPRQEGGKFAEKPKAYVNPMGEIHAIAKAAMQEAIKRSIPAETDRAALDNVKPKGQKEDAKGDPGGSKPASPTAKAKPEQTSTEATRQHEQQLDKAHKALKLEGWSEDDFADVPEKRILALAERAIEKHARVKREQRDAAEAAKKAPQADPASKGSPTQARATDQGGDAEDAEYVRMAEEHFKGFEAGDEEGTKAFNTSLARFGRAASERATAPLKAEFTEALTSLERGLRGEARLERALDRASSDFPQVEDKDVRSKVTAHVLALATGEDTKDEYRDDLPGAIRAACRALKLKDEGAERKRQSDDEIRAAKAGGQPITSSQQPNEREQKDIFRYAAEKALREHK